MDEGGRTMILMAAALLALQAEPVAVKGARLVPVSGPEIDSGTIVIRGGKIEALGKDGEVPWDAKAIDGKGKVVLPAFVEAHAIRGTDRPNERVASVPFVSTFDSINPVDPAFDEALRQGIATLGIFPGNDTLIGGQACVVRPVGVTTETMTIARNVALKISLKPRTGTSRMAHLAALRRELQEAADALKAPGEPDAKREPLFRALKGQLPVFLYCPTASDVHRALDLAAAFGLKLKLVLGRDAWKAAETLARAGLDLVLDSQLEYWETDEERHEEVLREGVKALARPGVRFALQTDGSGFGSSQIAYQAAGALRQGVPREAVLKSVTLWPAEFLGLGGRLGSLEKGKDGTLLVLSGDPFDVQTWVDLVIVDGKIVYERSRDPRLRRLFEGKGAK
jgi:imidazolonepropionase-like amidohydrolase